MSIVNNATALAVNPAFLQEIKDSNPDLWVTVRELRRICQSRDEPVRVSRQLTRLLDDLRDQVALQFSLEESYGYLAIGSPPCQTLCELACRAQAQHATLYLQLSELAERAEELQYRGVQRDHLRRLIEQSIDFDEAFKAHEKLEGDLIARSFGARRG